MLMCSMVALRVLAMDVLSTGAFTKNTSDTLEPIGLVFGFIVLLYNRDKMEHL